ncbi:MAG: hypothetical protein ABIU54_13050 [Candidatus Eisenbacteria bacterium]
MRRAGPQARFLLPFALLLALWGAGCGRTKKPEAKLTFEQLPDTAGLSQGRPILTELETMRMDGGALRVLGGADLPEGARLQIAIRRPNERSTVAMAHVEVHEHRFESPPLMGEFGPLPKARYRFEVTARFTPDWQPATVLRATNDGKTLRGPGITRDRNGDAMFFLSKETQR